MRGKRSVGNETFSESANEARNLMQTGLCGKLDGANAPVRPWLAERGNPRAPRESPRGGLARETTWKNPENRQIHAAWRRRSGLSASIPLHIGACHYQ